MTKYPTNETGANPFADADGMMLNDVIERLDKVADLTITRQRDMKSAIRTIARIVNKSPETTPANINWLHVRLRQVHPSQHGISKKRYQNIKSDALKALELTGASRDRKDWLRKPDTKWLDLLDRIPDKHDRWKLSQLAQYCSALGVAPAELNNTHIMGLRKALIEESFQNKPEAVVANSVKTWNRLSEHLPNWPAVTLSRPPLKKEPWTIPLEDFPQSFLEDVDRWTKRLTNPDILDGTGPSKPLRPATIAHRRFQIRAAASALVRSGYPVAKITSLSVLVQIDNLKAALRWMMNRFEGKPTEAIKGVAVCLQAIARHHVKAADDDLLIIKGIVLRLGRDADGLREKNRQRLLQLNDPANLAKLLHLPAILVEKAEGLFSSGGPQKQRKGALLIQVSLAIEILLNAPMRIGNLASLHLIEQLRPIQMGRDKRTHIHIPPQYVKNNVALDYELGADATKLLDLYLTKARPVLLDQPSDYLFPRMNGGSKAPSHLSQNIKNTILEHTGLVIHAHLFRSIAGKIHSLAHPGDIVTLAYTLNDSLKAYAQFEHKSALEHYQSSVVKARERTTS